MATAACQLSEDQFLCSICLDVFTDPVSSPCGHNFCKECINQHWSSMNIYNCPNCKEVFNSRPELKVNTFISEMAAHFRAAAQHKANRSSEQAVKPGGIPCDFCTEPKLKALKSCLVCLASYCDTHLEPHRTMSGLKRHQLIDPQENLEQRVCPEHSKLLELFCQNDQLCVCVLCTYSDHKSHEVVPLKDAFEQQKLKLGETEAEIQDMIKTRQLKVQELGRSVELNNENADKELTAGVKVFTVLKECVERGLDNLIQHITRKKTAAEDQAKGFIKELEQEISELKKRSTEVEQLSHKVDHFHLLQNFSRLSSTPPNKDWTNVSLCPQRFQGSVARALAQLEEDFNTTTKNLFKAELMRVKENGVSVSLDRNTAHPQLVVSEDGTNVKHSPEVTKVPNSPKRFDGLFVLGRQSFCRPFYFEALVRGKTEWTLGVAKRSVNRKGTITMNPQNGFWTISLRNGVYHASAEPEVCLSTKCKPEVVGVFVDYEEGIVSFYDVQAKALIYSFTGFSFKEQLYPFCSPGRYRSANSASMVLGKECWSVFVPV